MTHKCTQCGTAWTVPEDFDWWHLKQLRPDWVPSRALDYLHGLGVSGFDAKSIVGHQCWRSDYCHNCEARLGQIGIVTCKCCGALNYNL